MIVPVEPNTVELWRSQTRARDEGLTDFELSFLNESDVMDYLFRHAPCLQPCSEN